MSNHKKFLVTSFFISIAFILMGCGSSAQTSNAASGATAATSTSSSTSSGLTLALSTNTVGVGGTVQLTASGGVAPYYYGLISGSGNVDSTTGLFTAGQVTGVVTVGVEDSSNNIAEASITVTSGSSSGSLTVVYTPTTIYVSDTVVFTTSGGTAPYTYVLLSGAGSMNGNVYIAPSSPGSAVVEVSDSVGDMTTVNLTINPAGGGGGGSVNALTTVYVSPEGRHEINGGGCPSGELEVGEVADAGNDKIYGDQIFCDLTQSVSGSQSVVTNISITSDGQHIVGGPGCPSGWSSIGTITDCAGGYCYGNQDVCVHYNEVDLASQVVMNFYVSPENQHLKNNPPCTSGYTLVGTSTDCGGGHCYGNQSYCVQYGAP